MALFSKHGDDDHHWFGVFSAFVLNLSLLVLPFAALITWQALQNTNIYGYEDSAQARSRTARALENAVATLIPDNADRQSAWSRLVQREIDENDFSAARGFLLCAPAMLPPADASRLQAQLPPNANDKLRVDTALAFLDDAVRKQYEAGAAPPTQSAPFVSGAEPAGAIGSGFFLLGDLRDLTTQSAHWVNGDSVDVFALTLSGIGIALSPASLASAGGESQIKVGASIIAAAKRAGKLSPEFSAHMENSLFRAEPPARLKSALDVGLGAAKGADNDPAVTKAFQSSVDPNGLRALGAELADIKAMADATSAIGAVRLLAHAENAADLQRLRLIATAGGDRAVAAAKRLDSDKLLRSAKGALKMTRPVIVDFTLLGLSLAGITISVLATLGQALLREWRHGAHHHHDERRADMRA